MIYLKTGIGIELRGEDLLISSLQSNFSSGVFTHFKRIANFQTRDREEVRREIVHFFRSNGLGKDNIVLGIPRKDLILRYLDFPVEVADNLKQVVQYQVQSFEPTEEDKYYYDHVLLENSGPKKKLAVLLVMARKSLLDDRLQLLRELGIRPVAVTGSSMALSNVFSQNRKDLHGKTFILADLAPSGIELLALRSGKLVYSHEAPKEEDRSWREVILQEVDEAASKIRLGPEGAIEKILLAGESSESACEEIGSAIPDCELLKNSIRLAAREENKSRLQEAASALGLAYTGMVRRPSIRLNLLPVNLRIRQTRWAYIPAILLGLAIVALLAALGLRDMAQNRKIIRKLDQEIQSLKAPVESVQAVRNQADTLEKRIRSIEELLHKRDMNLEVLQELTVILPSDTYLNMYQYKEGTIILAGFAASAPDLIPKLERSPLLKDVTQKGAVFKDAQSGKDRFNFEAKLER
jgi:Tfp pilus assembly protein PilN